jgi:starch synthase
LKILIASSEAVPYVKTGGLADVAGALVKEFRKRKEEAFLVLPLYAAVKKNFRLHETGKTFQVKMGRITYKARIFASSAGADPEAYFIECDEFYDRPELYGTSAGDYPDNAARFIFFSKAVPEACIALDIRPDIIHCNDWQTALIPLYLKTFYRGNARLAATASVFTIHNVGFQGIFDSSVLLHTGFGKEYLVPERLEYYGKLNLMKAGLLYADLLNTVSETYAHEIQTPGYGFGLDGVLRKRASELYGILNGIDYDEWDPSNDAFIPAQFNHEDLSGKMKCRKELCRTARFEAEAQPVMSVISRLSSQKGIDMVLNSLNVLFDMGLNLVVLGRGDGEYERLFRKAAEAHRGRIFVHIGFEERLARRVYAGSDLFLMPSHYEPCGLGQLIAMRYGAVPVARRTGGLADTIQDYDHMKYTGTGFLFSDYSHFAMQDAVKRALCVFTSKTRMKKLAAGAMKMDFSWSSSAGKYLDLYRMAGRRVGR